MNVENPPVQQNLEEPPPNADINPENAELVENQGAVSEENNQQELGDEDNTADGEQNENDPTVVGENQPPTEPNSPRPSISKEKRKSEELPKKPPPPNLRELCTLPEPVEIVEVEEITLDWDMFQFHNAVSKVQDLLMQLDGELAGICIKHAVPLILPSPLCGIEARGDCKEDCKSIKDATERPCSSYLQLTKQEEDDVDKIIEFYAKLRIKTSKEKLEDEKKFLKREGNIDSEEDETDETKPQDSEMKTESQKAEAEVIEKNDDKVVKEDPQSSKRNSEIKENVEEDIKETTANIAENATEGDANKENENDNQTEVKP